MTIHVLPLPGYAVRVSALALAGLGVVGLGLSASALANDVEEAAKTEAWTPVPPTVAVGVDGVPSDATRLFDGRSLAAWEGENGGAAGWRIADGAMTVVPGGGGVRTKASFCDVQLHVEWRAPAEPGGMDGQDRGNSGIFLQQRYEVQVLDSYDNPTYANGQAASVYKQYAPLVNASRAPGEWQSYDILYTAPVFEDGELSRPAAVTVLHNGVLVQHDVEIQGTTEWIGAPSYAEAHGCAPLLLQDHDAKVSYRNIWVREL
ncbi:3-keto-disaccharide hydrolase [Halomonas sp. V046]|uniref:3-keto-disaccharide hydrolase n=1 Tax=Halomonas sp. V046 TaxID=3459611 RepID=UPI004043D4A3